MKKNFLLITFLCLSFYSLSFAAFEDLGVTVHGKVLGDGFVASCNDFGAIYYNPSMLCLIKDRELSVFYHNIYNLGLLDHTFVGYIHPKIGKGGIGIGWIRMGTSGNVDFMKYSENTFIFSYGQKFNRKIYVGGNIKYYFVDYDYRASGYGADFGSMLSAYRWLRVGLLWQNCVASNILWQTGTEEPINSVLKLGLGADYKKQLFLIGLRYEKEIETTIGWEWTATKLLKINAGSRFGSKENSTYSAGISIGTKKFKFNCGMEFHNILGLSTFLDMALKI